MIFRRFWYQHFENLLKTKVTGLILVKLSFLSIFGRILGPVRGCQLVIFFFFFFFFQKVHVISFPNIYISQNVKFLHIAHPNPLLRIRVKDETSAVIILGGRCSVAIEGRKKLSNFALSYCLIIYFLKTNCSI